ncbi:MAG: hypothetical protein GY851_21610 [bacterium]|nr:hypothetical protein [bacterium]
MTTNSHRMHVLLVLIAAAMAGAAAVQAQDDPAPYQPDWSSLRTHEAAPEWFRDAKYGIYMHWGVYSVPAFGSEWYPRNMHLKGRGECSHHAETYGDPAEFGYHDFAPMFKAEHFDPEEWADLFAKSGARYAGLVVEHHDGFAMWDSDLTPWNTMDTGPERDIAGDLATALRERDMRFVATFHHARNNQHLENHNGVLEWDGHYPRVEGWPTVSEDPELRMLYGNLPRIQFLDLWLGKLEEVIDKYQPDLIWFDSWLDEIPETYQMRFASHYLNRAQEWDKDVVITCKQRDLPFEVAVEDYEKGRAADITEHPFLTDDTISYGSWCYTQNLRIKPLSVVVHTFIDIVSKNGQLLLNISPKADGTIPDEQRSVLLGIGAWLERNGEAIYGTRPFMTFGEGPTRMKKSGHFVGNVAYTAEDIRFTRKGNALYAITLGKPGDKVAIKTLGKSAMPAVAIDSVAMLGHNDDLDWSHKKDALVITVPDGTADDLAGAFKIVLSGTATTCSGIELAGGKIATTFQCLGLSDAAWSGKALLESNGKELAQIELSAAPGEAHAFTLEAKTPGEGAHKIRVKLDGATVTERDVLAPVIQLTQGWRFSRGDKDKWKDPKFDDTGWDRVALPEAWESHSDYQKDPAYGWYRKSFYLPKSWKGRDLVLPLGQIDDADVTYFNGKEIGRSGAFPPAFKTAFTVQRSYRVPASLVRFGGENVIAIRAYDHQGGGGLHAGELGPVQVAD